MDKFTVIYSEAWMSGPHWHSFPKMARLEALPGENPFDTCERMGISPASVSLLFEGWPRLYKETGPIEASALPKKA